MQAMNNMTQSEIAKILNITQSAVSLAIGNPKTRRVSAAKKHQLFELLHQKSSEGTRIGKKTWNITCVMPFPDSNQTEGYIRFFNGIDDVLTQQGYSLLLERWNNDCLSSVAQHKTDGVIFMPKVSREEVARAVCDMPTVILNNAYPGFEYDSVLPDNSGSIHLLLEHLFRLGHRRIAFFSPFARNNEELPVFNSGPQERYAAYLSELPHFGLDLDPRLIATPFVGPRSIPETVAVIHDSFHNWMNSACPPTAILCMNDFYVLYFCREAHEAGFRIPEDISIVGIDNLEYPGQPWNITSIDQNRQEMGRLAAELLLKRINTPKSPLYRFSCKATLIVRDSSGPVPQKVPPDVSGPKKVST